MAVIETQTQTTTRGKGKGAKTTVKTTKSSTGTQTTRKGRSRGGNKRRAPTMAGGFIASQHWNMVRDPCHANLGESAYPGRAGLTNRFKSVTTYTTGTDTSILMSYNPASLAGAVNSAANSSTVVNPAYTVHMPGQLHLLANADSWRPIGCCLDIEYIGTELNRSGAIYGGVLPASNLPAGFNTTVDLVKTLLTGESRTPDHSLQLNWFPGTGDMDYSKSTDPTFADTHNNLTVCAEGLPAGLSLKVTVTVIVEWLPNVALGMTMPPPTAGTNPPAFYEHLHEKAAQSGAFNAFVTGAGQRGRAYAYYAGQRMVDATAGVAMASMYRSRNARIGY